VLSVGFFGAPAAQAARRPLPAGPTPSAIAKMVCASEAQRELADALGEDAKVRRPTWVHHRYTCAYQYKNGTYTLSVQEESSWGQTFTYYDSLKKQLGDARSLANLGQGAYQTRNGDVVVRKDWKVLLVNISGLPARFGVPATAAGDIAVTVADVILGCWAGD